MKSKKSKRLGTPEAVAREYPLDDSVSKYARGYAETIFRQPAQNTQPIETKAKEPESAGQKNQKYDIPEGVNLTSAGKPFRLNGAKKAAERHTKNTGERTEVVRLGGIDFGWRVTEPKVKRTFDRDGRVLDGKGIEPGEVFTTASGRDTTPYPGYSKTKTTKRDTNEADQWLIENAVAEAKAKEDRFNLHQFENMKPGQIYEADKASLNMYLFDKEASEAIPAAIPKPFLKPLVDDREARVDEPQAGLTQTNRR